MSTQPTPSPPAPPSRGVSGTTLILSLAAVVCATAAIVLAVVHFWPGAATEALLEQRGTVSPQSMGAGVVHYPLPYAAPPNLKLISAKREYDIVKQDETGFSWKALVKLDDIQDGQRGNAQAMLGVGIRHADSMIGKLKPDLQFEDFTWEAKGGRPGKDAVFVQEGTFNTIAGKEGEVNFPIPYAAAPNVELSGPPSGAVIVAESRPTGFKWRNTPQTNPGAVNSGSVSWKVKGVRATDSPPSKSQ
jgi:hypothetical protein